MYKIARCKDFLINEKSFFGTMNKIIYTLHKKLKLFFFLNEEKCLDKTFKTITKYQDLKETLEYFCYAAVYLPTPQKCFFKRDWFGKPQEVEFEGKKFFAPADSHNVLTALYKDYMQLPPKEQRRPTHNS